MLTKLYPTKKRFSPYIILGWDTYRGAIIGGLHDTAGVLAAQLLTLPLAGSLAPQIHDRILVEIYTVLQVNTRKAI